MIPTNFLPDPGELPDLSQIEGLENAREIFSFLVYNYEWEMDGTMWVVETPEGKRHLIATGHGRPYRADPDELDLKVEEYQEATVHAKYAIGLLMGGEPQTPDRVVPTADQ